MASGLIKVEVVDCLVSPTCVMSSDWATVVATSRARKAVLRRDLSVEARTATAGVGREIRLGLTRGSA